LVASQLVKAWSRFHPTERSQLLATLVLRPTFARALLEAVANGKIPRGDISAFHARQIRNFNDAQLTRQLTEVWGLLRESGEDKRQFIVKLRSDLTPTALAAADRSQGRHVFQTACAVCHKLYGQGAEIGPDLTGAGRDNLDYLLDNIVDPGAVVTADYRLSVLHLNDGRVLSGIIKARTDRTITLQSATELLPIERSEIQNIQDSALSLMPEGLIETLNAGQVRDLVAYLMTPKQVPLPAAVAVTPAPTSR
jgi:putative heme-binding domain-containing protein